MAARPCRETDSASGRRRCSGGSYGRLINSGHFPGEVALQSPARVADRQVRCYWPQRCGADEFLGQRVAKINRAI